MAWEASWMRLVASARVNIIVARTLTTKSNVYRRRSPLVRNII